jgi:hypothetical protein
LFIFCGSGMGFRISSARQALCHCATSPAREQQPLQVVVEARPALALCLNSRYHPQPSPKEVWTSGPRATAHVVPLHRVQRKQAKPRAREDGALQRGAEVRDWLWSLQGIRGLPLHQKGRLCPDQPCPLGPVSLTSSNSVNRQAMQDY